MEERIYSGGNAAQRLDYAGESPEKGAVDVHLYAIRNMVDHAQASLERITGLNARFFGSPPTPQLSTGTGPTPVPMGIDGELSAAIGRLSDILGSLDSAIGQASRIA